MLIVAVLVMATLAVCVALALEYTNTLGRDVKRSNTRQRAMEIGNGAIEMAYAGWRDVCRGSMNSSLATSAFNSIPMPVAANFPGVTPFTANRGANPNPPATQYTIANFAVKAVDPQMNNLADNNTAPPPATGRSPGTTSIFYLASADVTLREITGNIVVKVRRVFEKQTISPWNWALFYNDPLEIHPGPDFTLTGWVHTNSNLYTGHSTLHFASKVTYSGDWSVGFMPGDTTHPETPASPTFPDYLPPAREIQHLAFGNDPSRIFNTADSNPNNDSFHEIIDRPNTSYSDPLAGQRFYDQAGVKILIDSANSVTILNDKNNQVKASSSGKDLQLYNTFTAAISTNKTIQDNREAAQVRLVDLNVAQIKNDIAAGKLPGFNGIIYISDTSAGQTGGSPKRGIRLKNGATLPTGGLTFASDNPVFVQGDFNTGVNPPSNTGTYTQPTATGYTWQPAAILADAVNVLSNAWADSNSTLGLASRIASNTTVNAAILAGNVPTGGGKYSGGAENFPRFLENWSNQTFTYYGSMVQLYQSKQSIGAWGTANVYNPPNRQWFFDSNFFTTAPPGTLNFINYVKQRWYLL